MKPSWRKDYLRRKAYFLNMVEQYNKRADVKAYLEILLSLSTICILAIFALRPTLITIAKLLKEIESKKNTIKIMDEKIENLRTAQSLYEQEKDRIALLNISIPKKPNPDMFARQIEGLSGKHQVGITRMSVGEATILGKQSGNRSKGAGSMPKGTYGLKYSVNTSIDPNQYLQTVNFLSDFEKLRRPPMIDRVTFDIDRGENDNKILIMSIVGKLPQFIGVKTQAK
jgi:hypothetical protein